MKFNKIFLLVLIMTLHSNIFCAEGDQKARSERKSFLEKSSKLVQILDGIRRIISAAASATYIKKIWTVELPETITILKNGIPVGKETKIQKVLRLNLNNVAVASLIICLNAIDICYPQTQTKKKFLLSWLGASAALAFAPDL